MNLPLFAKASAVAVSVIPPQYKLLAQVLLIAAALGAVFYSGWAVNGWRLGVQIAKTETALAEARVEASAKARQIEAHSAALAQLNGEFHAALQAAEAARGRAITKRVIEYVQAPHAGRCALPADWVRLDTASAAGVPPDAVPVPGAAGAASGFTDADALAVIVERNRVCRAEINKLTALQKYVRDQLALLGNPRGKPNE